MRRNSELKLLSPSVYIDNTETAKGRGVFAARHFSKNDLVEVAPVIVFKVCALPRIIVRIIYQWEVLAKIPQTRAIALGYGSLYNHNNPANLQYRADAATETISYLAVRDIEADEELTINYNASNGAHEAHDDTWFRQNLVERI